METNIGDLQLFRTDIIIVDNEPSKKNQVKLNLLREGKK